MRAFRKEKRTIKCFTREFQRENLSSPINRGVTSVEIANIVGSVGRYMNFTEGFKPRRSFITYNQRLNSIKQTMKERKELPLVELYKVRDDYYVVDGHHRIAAAKDLGMLSIDASVVEFLPLGDNPEDELYRAKTFFEIKTGLPNIQLSHKDLYSTLMDEIKRYHKRLETEDRTFTLNNSARKWYFNRYQPAKKKIEESDILRYFTDFTLGDFYIYLRQHRRPHLKKLYVETLNEKNNQKEFEQLTRELSFMMEEDPCFDSDETIQRCDEIFPSLLYNNVASRSSRQPKKMRSIKQRIVSILSHI
jgi:hypothetical protein